MKNSLTPHQCPLNRENHTNLDVSNWENGVYLIHALSMNGNTHYKTFVVNE